MKRYKITYTITDYENTIHGKRINGEDEYEADNARDAVNRCKQNFYAENEIHINSVAKWSPYGYWIPVFDGLWK